MGIGRSRPKQADCNTWRRTPGVKWTPFLVRGAAPLRCCRRAMRGSARHALPCTRAICPHVRYSGLRYPICRFRVSTRPQSRPVGRGLVDSYVADCSRWGSPSETELVAFGIGEHRRLLGVISGLIQHACAETDEAVKLCGKIVRAEVDMHTILHGLGLGDGLQEQLWTGVGRPGHKHAVVFFVCDRPAERLRPETAQGPRVSTVDRHVPQGDRHDRTVAAVTCEGHEAGYDAAARLTP